MKKTALFSLILTSFLFGQENQVTIQDQNTNNEQSVFEANTQKTVLENEQTLAQEEQMQTIQTNIIPALDAYERMKINKDFFIIDIRAPQKIAVIGAINNTNLHIAYENFSTNNYKFEQNKYFYEELKYEITSKNIPFEKDIYIFDNYGNSISSEVGKFLNELGYLNVYTLEDGFEGSKAKYGKFKNQRVVSGWKNKTDLWSLDFFASKYWSECKYSFLFEPVDRKVCEPDFVEEVQESGVILDTQNTQEIIENQEIKKASPSQLFN